MFSFNRFYYHALHLSLVQLYACTLLFIFLSGAGWWYFLYRPYAQSINQLYATIENDSMRLTQVKKMERELAHLTKSLPSLQAQVQRHMQSQKGSKYSVLSLLIDTAKKNNMNLHACHFCNEEHKGWCTAYQITFNGTGSFEQIISFLKH